MKQLKFILTFFLLTICVTIFAQGDTTEVLDQPSDWADWLERILAAIGIIWPGYSIFFDKSKKYGSKARDLFTEFVNAVDDGRITSVEARNIAAKGRDVVK